jgi:flotillin
MAAPDLHLVRDPDHRTPGGAAAPAPRYQEGWRSGKPLEDPEKLKRWGWIGAKPSEYLVCTRRGEIDRKRSGQGVRIFKWPWDTVAIVPTTLQRIEFMADQITREHVGVSVTGIAVYRIAVPELAFRVLNFTYGEAASEKLAATLREMFVGAARRLVANLSLQECLTKRKETIATYLMEEIAPVVGGEGSLDDTTGRGWGVVIDTIEIQQVTIQSELVFNHLQAPFRAEIAARSELAELERARQVAERRAETERLSQEAHLESVRATRALKARTEAEAAEIEAKNRAAAALATIEADATRVEAIHRAGVLEQERSHALAMQRLAAEAEVRRAQAGIEHELRRRETETRDVESQSEATAQRRLAEIELLLAQSRTLRELVATAVPQLAAALQPHAQTMHYTLLGGPGAEGGPLGAVPQAIAQVLALAQSFGLEPKR